jgi:hypothetical protein
LLKIGVGTRLAVQALTPVTGDGHVMAVKTVGMREGVISALVFSAILFALISVDPGVKIKATDLVRGNSVSSVTGRVGDMGGALWSAARNQSIDNAPMLVFATIGTMLTLFMVKS